MARLRNVQALRSGYDCRDAATFVMLRYIQSSPSRPCRPSSVVDPHSVPWRSVEPSTTGRFIEDGTMMRLDHPGVWNQLLLAKNRTRAVRILLV